MKGFFSEILILIVAIASLTIIIENKEINSNYLFINNFSNDSIKLNEYQIALNEMGWDYNWKNENPQIINDFNLASELTLNQTFNETLCTTKDWTIIINSDLNKIGVTYDINCITQKSVEKNSFYNNFSKKIIIRNKP